MRSPDFINKTTQEWLKSLYLQLEHGRRDWVGVYWIESFINPETPESNDLVVGPYIGPNTPHTRIPISQGICGLAAREGRTINIDDVSSDSRFLACSIETKSEIVIPIRDDNKQVVGELDIDSNNLSSFDLKIQTFLEKRVRELERLLFC